MKHGTKVLAIMGRAMLLQSKALAFAFGLSAATKLIDTQKALAKIRSRALPTVFLPRAFYKNQPSYDWARGLNEFYFLSCFLTMYPANISSNSSIVPCVIRSFWHINALLLWGK